MKKYNFSAECIKELLLKKKQLKANLIKEYLIGLNVTFAFGNIYIRIEDVFTDKENEYPNDKNGYGSLNFLGNINGKTERQLYFKTKELKVRIDHYRTISDELTDATQKAISDIKEKFGKPNEQVSVIYHNL